MRIDRTGWLLIATLVLAAVPAAEGCSAMLRPVEAVIAESDVIVRTRVIGADAPGPGRPGQVTLEVIDVLKGRVASPWVSVEGRIGRYRAAPGRRPPYEQIDCEGRVPGCGSCFAQTYKADAQYLLLLKGGTPYWAALSPTNEEVSGADDPWVSWVKRRLPGPAPPR